MSITASAAMQGFLLYFSSCHSIGSRHHLADLFSIFVDLCYNKVLEYLRSGQLRKILQAVAVTIQKLRF